MKHDPFRTDLGRNVFRTKYAQGPEDTWDNLARRVVDDVCGSLQGTSHAILSQSERDFLVHCIATMKFIPGGRYLYYAGRQFHAWNNCYLLRAEEDTREEWAALVQRATACLMTGGGIGIDYSILRPSGRTLRRTGGISSGPIPLMKMINEVGRNVMQGGSRRSAIYASLNWQHPDIEEFLIAKNWADMPIGKSGYSLHDAKFDDFNWPAPLDQTNISVNYDDEWLNQKDRHLDPIFVQNVRQALTTGEPGFSFNFGDKQYETLRNACCEVTSEDDSDVCNLGSINIGALEDLDEFRDIVRVASKFLVCGTIRADLPYKKVYEVRERNRRLGLGLMGIHEFLLRRGSGYEVTPELHKWLKGYRDESVEAANEHCDRLYLSRPVAYRAIAPTGTIALLPGTTSGIEPLYAAAYKRRYLTGGSDWMAEYVQDPIAIALERDTGIDPSGVQTALRVAATPEVRIKFQAAVQAYVDQAISSTINLPSAGSLDEASFAKTLSKYAPQLRGFTAYPDGARGGQPIEEVDWDEAKKMKGVVIKESEACKGGVCGI